jgi:hypothetical protein
MPEAAEGIGFATLPIEGGEDCFSHVEKSEATYQSQVDPHHFFLDVGVSGSFGSR